DARQALVAQHGPGVHGERNAFEARRRQGRGQPDDGSQPVFEMLQAETTTEAMPVRGPWLPGGRGLNAQPVLQQRPRERTHVLCLSRLTEQRRWARAAHGRALPMATGN